MKIFPFIPLLTFLIACDQSSHKPSKDRKPPRIEVIECSGPPKEVGLERTLYFNKKVLSRGDTTTVSFDFVQDCCLDIEGKWKLDDDVLILSYQLKDKEQLPCECKCTYTAKFHFMRSSYSWSRVSIRKEW
ncbi:MAG: hypothetical protein NXI10_12635 [bacterium]|nr:hypothetical protein [bacterium]